MRNYDAVIVGSGPNGLSAAITLQRQGLSTIVIEGADTIGGGLRTKELTLPGFKHDVCSAIHPMAMASPFFKTIPFQDHGLSFIQPTLPAAHPLDHGDASVLYRSIEETAESLGVDRNKYIFLFEHIVNNYEALSQDTLGPLAFPKRPFTLSSFGVKALPPASWMSKLFKNEKSRALWAGMAAHGIQPLENWTTSAIALMLMSVGHKFGWPIPVGGSQSIADALGKYYQSLGGEIQTNFWVEDVRELPPHKLLFLDMTPKQLVNLKGGLFTDSYINQLKKYRQGMGVFKIDWALSEPVPFSNPNVRNAGTVHIGGTFAEIAQYEKRTHHGEINDKPFVLFAQQGIFDKTRAPEGKQTGWAYCHAPNGVDYDYTEAIENQIERFAPGFRDTILAKHTFTANEMEQYNPNYVGGDINGGIMDIQQLYTRPIFSLKPYRTSKSNVYICSSSTPPGGGVHGMCGFHAAKIALQDHFGVKLYLS